MPDRFDDIAGAGFALRPDHRRSLGTAPESFAEIPAAAHERHGEPVLIDVVLLIGRSQNFAFIDEVDLEGFEDLCFYEVADPALCHDRDRNDVLDAKDHFRVAHTGDPTVTPDIGRYALECHDRDRAGVFGNLSLVRVDDVHNDAALQHLCETNFFSPGFLSGRHTAVLVHESSNAPPAFKRG